jgi:hypothetical protein
MFTRLRRRAAVALFDWQCRGILGTPPLRLRPAPLIVVTMLRTEHVRMYLLAIKSFYRHLPGGRVLVLDDGSLTAADTALLGEHLPGVEIERLDAVDTGPCPRGGCWERLLRILDLSVSAYVVQLDSDILATGPIPAVTAAIAGNTCFTLNSGEGMGIEPLEQAAARVAAYSTEHLQMAAERRLPELPADLPRRYVRGSAGFAGFARGALARPAAEAFSTAMQAMLGPRWTEWGSEQITSNYLIANAPGGLLLPWPRYACFEPSVDPAQADLLHFVGAWRFDRGVYAAKARRVITDLRRGG